MVMSSIRIPTRSTIPWPMQPSVVARLQGRTWKAEMELKQREDEITVLKQQLQQYEVRWLEYEAKMKSMEEMWQKQVAALQMSLTAERNGLATNGTVCRSGNINKLPTLHDHYCEGTMPTETRGTERTPTRQSYALLSCLAKEFGQQMQVFEDDAQFLLR
ncbi:myosin-1-like [Typha latifolia]|uniref:myosin-1-like n=1 Tax=Typha latifolia TaxID=4733 RepID=UPI003C2E7678